MIEIQRKGCFWVSHDGGLFVWDDDGYFHTETKAFEIVSHLSEDIVIVKEVN